MFTPIFHLKPKTKRLYKYRKNIRFETQHGKKITNCRLSTYCNILSPAISYFILPKKTRTKNNSFYKQGFSIGSRKKHVFSKTGETGPSLPPYDQIRAKDLLS